MLRALPRAALDDFLQTADLVSLPRHEVIYHASGVGDWGYFPVSGVLGGFTSGVEGAQVQAMLVCPDGMVGGLRAVLDVQAATLAVRVTVAGEAFALPMSEIRVLAERHGAFRNTIQRSALRLLCARLHTLTERASTWLLVMSHHSTPPGVVRLTHEELAEIVGASRPSLSVVISALAEEGVIEAAGRGRILIEDEAGLSRLACECWRLFIGPSPADSPPGLERLEPAPHETSRHAPSRRAARRNNGLGPATAAVH